jgi:hypothetical protein
VKKGRNLRPQEPVSFVVEHRGNETILRISEDVEVLLHIPEGNRNNGCIVYKKKGNVMKY